ncbi:MAG: hypothetical protein IPP42_01300 [Saprospiraceae bacterium]|nr:hypothetical protein [Saprospiraceae bacterium]
MSKDETELYAISCRGYGAGPNGGDKFVSPPQGTYIGDIQLVSFHKIKMPDPATLTYTQQTLANTFLSHEITDDKTNPLPPYQQ